MITVASRCEAAFWSWGNSTDNSTDCLPMALLTSLRSVEVIIFCKQGRVAAEKMHLFLFSFMLRSLCTPTIDKKNSFIWCLMYT